MKHLKDLNENFKLFDQEPTTPEQEYADRVHNNVYNVIMDDLGISEKDFDRLDRMELIMEQTKAERLHEFDTIVQNSRQRGFRTQYAAEIAYDTLYKKRFKALIERDWLNGGLKR